MFFSMLVMALGIGISMAESESIQHQFMQLDADSNGVITDNEVNAKPEVIRYMHLHYDGSFSTADVNKDGVIDRAEFSAFEEDLPGE
jgi:Ca2+-binding EF-hand superfamily protein